MEDGMDGQWRD